MIVIVNIVNTIVNDLFFQVNSYLFKRCGVDTLLAYSRDELIGFAREDTTRIILTCGKSFDQVCHFCHFIYIHYLLILHFSFLLRFTLHSLFSFFFII